MNIRQIPYIAGPLVFALSCFAPEGTLSSAEWIMIGTLGWMLIWWVTEILNLAVTALLPIVLLPMAGIMDIKTVTSLYGHPYIYLFFGGFVLALAIEKWNLHRRIALYIIRKVGTSPKRILLGFMIATSFLSAWISNTATTVMMLPMVLSVLKLLKQAGLEDKKLNISLLMGVAWAANIGGMSTLIGTPPNAVFTGFYAENFQTTLTFFEWAKVGTPVAAVLFFVAYGILSFMLRKVSADHSGVRSYLEEEWKNLGKMTSAQKKVSIVFASTAVLWIVRAPLSEWLHLEGMSDTTIAIISAITLFVIPADKGNSLLVWKDTRKLAWGILLLFGGGLALAAGMNESGLLNHITNTFNNSDTTALFAWIFAMAVLGIWATEIMSNMALVAAMMPIVAAIASGTGQPFYLLALPLTLGSSCAFMLPMATPPNAIVFSSGHMKIADMVKRGVLMNIAATLVISVLVYLLSLFVL